MECPRKYFYKYMLGWKRKSGNIHLDFGSAIHLALEHFNNLRKNNGRGYRLTDQDIADAVRIFRMSYRENHPAYDDKYVKPKDYETGKDAIICYAEEYDFEDGKEELLYTETTGAVAVDENILMHYKCDIITKDDRGIFPRDYKTSQRMSDLWSMDFVLRIQMGTYIHAVRCTFPDQVDHVWGMEVRGIFLYKAMSSDRKYGNIDFKNVAVRKSSSDMEVWRQTVIAWTDALRNDMDDLEYCDAEQPTMVAFPMNPTSCTNYGGCPFHDFCSVWPNPLSRVEKPPMDFEVNFWDPRKQQDNY